MSAWRIAGIVHATEEWNVHECGSVMFNIERIWKASLEHGFRPLTAYAEPKLEQTAFRDKKLDTALYPDESKDMVYAAAYITTFTENLKSLFLITYISYYKARKPVEFVSASVYGG